MNEDLFEDKVERAFNPIKEYVVGFAHDGLGNVALIRKTHPAWQAGRLNGIGGSVEKDEFPRDAMRREFLEEAGLDVEHWQLFLTIDYPDTEVRVRFYRTKLSVIELAKLKSMTDEEVVVTKSTTFTWHDHIKNLSWIVPLAVYEHADYFPAPHLSAQNLTGHE